MDTVGDKLTAVEVKTGNSQLTKGQNGVAQRTASGERVAVNETTKKNKDLHPDSEIVEFVEVRLDPKKDKPLK